MTRFFLAVLTTLIALASVVYGQEIRQVNENTIEMVYSFDLSENPYRKAEGVIPPQIDRRIQTTVDSLPDTLTYVGKQYFPVSRTWQSYVDSEVKFHDYGKEDELQDVLLDNLGEKRARYLAGKLGGNFTWQRVEKAADRRVELHVTYKLGVKPTSITVTPRSINLYPGQDTYFSAVVNLNNGESLSGAKQGVVFSNTDSLQSDSVIVAENGHAMVATYTKPGSYKVVATYGTFTDTVMVNVLSLPQPAAAQPVIVKQGGVIKSIEAMVFGTSDASAGFGALLETNRHSLIGASYQAKIWDGEDIRSASVFGGYAFHVKRLRLAPIAGAHWKSEPQFNRSYFGGFGGVYADIRFGRFGIFVQGEVSKLFMNQKEQLGLGKLTQDPNNPDVLRFQQPVLQPALSKWQDLEWQIITGININL